MAPREHLCKLNWGNSVSPAENQLPYGFKIKHTHTIKAWGVHNFRKTEPRWQPISRASWKLGEGQPLPMCLLEATIYFLLVPEVCSPSGR